MARFRLLAAAALVCAAVLAVAGCGSTQAAEPRSDPIGSGTADPRLSAAADTIQTLTARGSTTFAGLVLDPHNRTITVYRLPDPTLDARIRAATPGVRIVFRDAAYSLVQMTALIRQITADQGYWRTRGIQINGAAPQADGSAVSVFVADNLDAARRELTGRYPAMRMIVQQQTAVHPTMHGPFPTITVTGPPPPKTLQR
jgi:hypothetical protein